MVEVTVTRGVTFGSGRVGYGTPGASERPLLMDVYEPVAGGTAPRPALVLAFGGAYHRGSREADAYQDGDHRNTPIADYCRRFAAHGYVAVSVDYRLVPEAPDPVDQPVRRKPDALPRARIDYIRMMLGYPEATHAMLLNGVEAAYRDVELACRFVHAQADRWRIDPARIALGGFSSGAASALYAAYARRAPAAALVAISGTMAAEDIAHYVTGAAGNPPAILFVGENDLAGVDANHAELAAHFQRSGIRCLRYSVPGAPHFYPRTAPALPVPATASPPGSVEDAIVRFLAESLNLPPGDL